MPLPPIGSVTFLFTDIEGVFRLWQERPEAVGPALAACDKLVRECVEAHQGNVFKNVYSTFRAAFPTARLALEAALAAQLALADPAARRASGLSELPSFAHLNEEPVRRASHLYHQSRQGRDHGDYAQAREWQEESSLLVQPLGDLRAVSAGLTNLGSIEWEQGHDAAALRERLASLEPA